MLSRTPRRFGRSKSLYQVARLALRGGLSPLAARAELPPPGSSPQYRSRFWSTSLPKTLLKDAIPICLRNTLALGAWLGLTLPSLSPAQSPRSPSEELASFRLADPDLQVELVAAEPRITSPVAVAWDAHGTLFVAEMNDYPTAPSGGRIRRLLDADRNGFYESATTFASDLHFPSSIQPWRDGILVAAAPDILFLRDTDLDGRADERRVLFSGFAEGNQQLRVNGLTWAPDNWIYGANGRSDGEVRGGALASPLSLRRHDFRFQPDSGRIETLAGPSQFGIAFDTAGSRFLSWNTIPVRHEVIPERYTADNPAGANIPNLQDCLDPADSGEVFPLTAPPQTFNRESTRHFNALAGLHWFGGDALGSNYVGSVFVGETLRSLVHRRVLHPSGPTFVAKRAAAETSREFLASSDPWFHPVQFATGPDGALYICDFYRRWVEHPGFVPEHLRSKHDWREGWEHGRLWRVVSKKVPAPQPGPSRLAELPSEKLVDHLAHPNAWQRLTAQRLIAERGHTPAVVEALSARLQSSSESQGLARYHALWALENAGILDDRALARSLSDPDPSVRRTAVTLLEKRLRRSQTSQNPTPPAAPSWDGLAGMPDNEPSRSVRLQWALTARWLPTPQRIATLTSLLEQDGTDPWISRAVLLSSAGVSRVLLDRLLTSNASIPFAMLHELGFQAGLDPAATGTWIPPVPSITGAPETAPPLRDQRILSVAAGYLEGRRRSDPSWSLPFDGPFPYRDVTSRTLNRTSGDTTVREHALRLLILHQRRPDLVVFVGYLDAIHPTSLSAAAADTLWPLLDAPLADAIFEQWPNAAIATRRRLLALAPRSPVAAMALLRRVQSGTVPRAELDPVVRDSLHKHADKEVRTLASTLLPTPTARERESVIAAYRKALESQTPESGNPNAGARLFAQNCSVCHRLGNRGVAIGPDLTGIGSRPREALLEDLIVPSQIVAPDFRAYVVSLRDGEEWSGLLIRETPTDITLRRPNLPDETIPRSRIANIQASEKSLMPDGFENLIPIDRIADLLAFLANPRAELLPEL